MRAVTRALAVALIAFAALTVPGCVSTGNLHQRPWVEVRTPNFMILSCRKPGDAVELARRLEIFRSVAEFTIGRKLPTSAVPTTVYAFDTPITYRPFAERYVAGYFRPTMRGNTIVIGGPKSTGVDPLIVIQHEYVHYLLSSDGGFLYPIWYHEGFAEFLGNTHIAEDRVMIGDFPDVHTIGLRGPRMRIEKLLSVSAGSRIRVEVFYARSWALVHYLNFGRDGSQNTTAQLTRYFRDLGRGATQAQAVQHAFGISIDQLGDELDDYISDNEFKSVVVGVDSFDPGAEPTLRIPSQAEVATHLGGLLLAREKFDAAASYFDAALELEPGSARALSGIAEARAAQGREDEAEVAFAAALAEAPDDALTHLAYANFLRQRAEAATDDGERATLAREARRHYLKSWKLDDSIPETYAMYGSTYLLDGQEATLGEETLEHAHELLPSSPEIKIRLARLKLETGHPKDARRLALATAAGNHDEAVKEEIEEILDRTGGA
jgi:tetratricopeptide (TPR) repeat protein